MIDLFPGVISRPVTVREAWDGLPKNGKDKRIGHDWINVKEGSKTEKALLKTKPGGKVGSFGGSRKLNFKKVAGSILTGGLLPGYPGSSWPSHPSELRGISAREAARCSSYPDLYSIGSDWRQGAKCIGNSVPPLLMKAIATQIRHKLWNGEPLTRYPKTMTYPEILEAAWQDHLKPKAPDAPTVISTFAGGGGSSLGYSMAGYRELLAVEWDNNAVETFKLNFPDVPVYHGDIAKLSVEECMELAGLSEPGELDLFDGSPPCQSFSSAGKRDINDPRGQLFREYVRLLRGLKPKVFVMENVPGLVKGKMKLVFAEIMRELKASGYQVRCKKLNAMYFYVPQSRERLIFIGVRDDLVGEVSFPKAESRATSVREALKGVSGDSDIPAPPLSAKVTKISKSIQSGERHKKWYGVCRLPLMKPSFTLSKSPSQFENYPKVLHPIESRGISGGEMKRIGSYPDGYNMRGDWNDIQNRIGNSVPPLFMRSIAEHIRNNILTNSL